MASTAAPNPLEHSSADSEISTLSDEAFARCFASSTPMNTARPILSPGPSVYRTHEHAVGSARNPPCYGESTECGRVLHVPCTLLSFLCRGISTGLHFAFRIFFFHDDCTADERSLSQRGLEEPICFGGHHLVSFAVREAMRVSQHFDNVPSFCQLMTPS